MGHTCGTCLLLNSQQAWGAKGSAALFTNWNLSEIQGKPPTYPCWSVNYQPFPATSLTQMTCTEHCLEIGSCPIRWGFKHTIEMLATEDGSLVNNGELNDSFVNDASTIKSVNQLQRMIQICFFQMTNFA